VVGKFLLGMVSGGLVVTGGLVIASALFPVAPANDNAAATVAEPIASPDPASADAGAAEGPAAPETAEAEPEETPEAAFDAAVQEAVDAATEQAKAAALTTKGEDPVADATPPDAAAQPAVETVLAAPEATVTEGTEPVAPAAAEVTAPETLAEPSKPANPATDAAAAAPEAPAEPLQAEADAPDAAPSDAAPAEPVTLADAVTSEATLPAETEAEVAAPAEAPAAEVATVDAEPAETEVAAEAADEIVIAEAAPAPEVPVAEAPAAEAMPAEPPAPETAAETIPAPETAQAEASAEPSAEEAAPAMPGTRPDALPGETAEAETEARSSTFKPAPGLPRASETVEDPAAAPDADPAAPPPDPRPIVQFAAEFENPDAKPAFAIVLIDDGSADLDRASLAALPFPVSFALNPLDPASAQHAATYRAAGKEVVMLVTGIAQGAMPADVEVAFQSMAQGLPEAVAVMDLPEPSFQNRRPLAATVVPILKEQGRGLLTWDAGLNAADQVARREDLAAGVIFRDIGSTGADAAAIRRLLDRAVFKAGQEGRVSVVGKADAATVAALLEWSVEGKSATVALAPVTAVLTVE
jgi:polysaccharide deacetylase 2 family uncharacterized protein YibQ